MKNYLAPEMEILAFATEEDIANASSGNIYNDAQFGQW